MVGGDSVAFVITSVVVALGGAYGVNGTIQKSKIAASRQANIARNLLSRWRDWYQSGDPKPPPPRSLLDDTDRELSKDIQEAP